VSTTTTTTSVEETLAWEAEKRPRAASIAVAGGLLTVMGNILRTILLNGGPTEADGFISVTGAMRARLEGQEPEGPSLLVRQIDHWGDNAPLLGVSTILSALGVVCLGLTALFLYRATAARTSQIGRLPLYMTLAGLVLLPLGSMIRDFAYWIGAAGFEDADDRTAGGALDLLGSPAVAAGSLIEFIGTFGMAVGIVLVALNAMRVGLLTRFFGVLGILTGVLTIFQADQPGIVRAFWLVGVGLLIAGRLNTPPAWETGRAEPWPTQQQLREQRDAARGDRAERVSRPEDEADTPPKPENARKKRKRRR
jgi:hypothetical protein